MAGPWEKYGGSQSQAYPGIAPPDPYKQDEAARQTRADARDATRDELLNRVTTLEISEKEKALAEADEKARTSQAGQAEAAGKLSNVINLIDNIAFGSSDNAGWFETGAT